MARPALPIEERRDRRLVTKLNDSEERRWNVLRGDRTDADMLRELLAPHLASVPDPAERSVAA